VRFREFCLRVLPHPEAAVAAVTILALEGGFTVLDNLVVRHGVFFLVDVSPPAG